MADFEEKETFGSIEKDDTNSIEIRAVSMKDKKPYLDIRTYVINEGYQGFTKKGITINELEDMKELRKSLDRAIEWFEEKGWSW